MCDTTNHQSSIRVPKQRPVPIRLVNHTNPKNHMNVQRSRVLLWIFRGGIYYRARERSFLLVNTAHHPSTVSVPERHPRFRHVHETALHGTKPLRLLVTPPVHVVQVDERSRVVYRVPRGGVKHGRVRSIERDVL